ncbi:type II secretion system F family protein [Mycobacterium sp. NPDC050551]|uniref:type II secretion system F family protein n=1 Tax=Mycobacterium sp. NPDC050551 TaxID=3155407 RepID=UPI00342C7F6D
MTAAALALAAAVLIAPVSPRRRLVALRARPVGPRRVRPAWCLAVAAAAIAMLVPVTVAIAGAIVGGTLVLRRRRRGAQRLRVAESAALQAALDVLAGELRAGAHPVAAFGVAASEADEAVAPALRAVAARARLGADVAAGLRSVAARSSLPGHWERVAVSWRLAQTHGLAIGTLMRAAQRDVAERQRFSARVNAGMAGARTTATMLACLPVLGIGLGQLIGAEPVRFLLSGGTGGWLLVVGVSLGCAGLLWSDRITAGVVA